MNSRGQVSLEYLMTYGWAILIVLGLVVVAWNMGYLDIAGEVEPGQLGFWGVVPKDYVLDTDGGFTLILENQLDHNVTVNFVQVVLGQEEEDLWTTDWATLGVLAPGNITAANSLSNGFPSQRPGSNYRVFLNITYEETETGTPREHVSSGWVWSYVES